MRIGKTQQHILLCTVLLGLLFGFVFFSQDVFAAPNQQINYQGKLTDDAGATVADGDFSITFSLYTQPSGGSAVWTETTSNTITSGLFSVMLGSSTPLTSVDFNQTLYLGINVESDGEMSPRKILGIVPAAFEAQQLDGLATSSFLRADQADTASGLLTFANGFISQSSSTVSGLTTLTATTTNFVINGQRFTNLLGSGLTNTGGALTANISESNLNIDIGPTNGYVLQASSTSAGGFVWVSTTTLGFADSGDLSNYLPLTGGTLSGDLTLSGTAANIALGSNYLSGDGDDEGVFVDGSGKVGIGTASPVSSLDVEGSLLVRGGVGGNLYFDSAWKFRQAGYGQSIVFSENSGSILFLNTTSSGAGSGSPAGVAFRMALDKDGNLGIGTTTPQTRLHVWENSGANGSDAGVLIENEGLGDAVLTFIASGDNSRWTTGIDNSDSDKYKIGIDDDWDSSSGFLTIDRTGNVGIGTTTPTSRLAIQTTGTTDILNLFETGGTEVFTVLENGNVGWGRRRQGQSCI